MEQIGKEIEKVIKAGIGAVKTGVEFSAETLEKLAQKGEPLYMQAKSSICEAAGKVKKAVDDSNIPENFSMMLGGKVTVDTVISVLRRLNKEELDAIRSAIEAMYDEAPDTEKDSESEEQCACGCEKQSACSADTANESSEENN